MGGEKKNREDSLKERTKECPKLQKNRDGAKDGPSKHHDQSSRSQAEKVWLLA